MKICLRAINNIISVADSRVKYASPISWYTHVSPETCASEDGYLNAMRERSAFIHTQFNKRMSTINVMDELSQIAADAEHEHGVPKLKRELAKLLCLLRSYPRMRSTWEDGISTTPTFAELHHVDREPGECYMVHSGSRLLSLISPDDLTRLQAEHTEMNERIVAIEAELMSLKKNVMVELSDTLAQSLLALDLMPPVNAIH